MPRLEDIYYPMFQDEPDSEENNFYFNKFVEAIEKYTDPAYDSVDMCNYFADITGPLGLAQEHQGFKRGFSLALSLAVQALYVPDKTRNQVEFEYHRHSKEPPQKIEVTAKEEEA